MTTSPLHRGLATDCLVAEWHLDSPRVIAAIGDIATESRSATAFAEIEVPGELERWKMEELQQVQRVQQHLREEFTRWFASGYAAWVRARSTSGTAYVLAPWSDF